MRIATLIATVVLGAGVVSAQSLGDAARQERIRRAGLEKRAQVLTNEDFSREKILPASASESAVRAPQHASSQPAARAVPAPAAAPENGPVRVATPQPQPQWETETQEVSLGAYAREVRAERARRAARAQEEQTASANPSAPPPAAPEQRPWVKDESPVPAWTAHEQPGFSLGEYARAQRALRHKDVPVLTLDAKATPAPVAAPPVSVTAKQGRKDMPARATAAPTALPGAAIRVKKGDSLWKLSRAHLGEGRLWPAIWAANPQVRNPHMIRPGQSLSRPSEQAVAKVRRGNSSVVVVAMAKLAPAPQPQALRPRTVGFEFSSHAIPGPVAAPAGQVRPARRAAVSSDRKHTRAGAGNATHQGGAERPAFPHAPGS